MLRSFVTEGLPPAGSPRFFFQPTSAEPSRGPFSTARPQCPFRPSPQHFPGTVLSQSPLNTSPPSTPNLPGSSFSEGILRLSTGRAIAHPATLIILSGRGTPPANNPGWFQLCSSCGSCNSSCVELSFWFVCSCRRWNEGVTPGTAKT